MIKGRTEAAFRKRMEEEEEFWSQEKFRDLDYVISAHSPQSGQYQAAISAQIVAAQQATDDFVEGTFRSGRFFLRPPRSSTLGKAIETLVEKRQIQAAKNLLLAFFVEERVYDVPFDSNSPTAVQYHSGLSILSNILLQEGLTAEQIAKNHTLLSREELNASMRAFGENFDAAMSKLEHDTAQCDRHIQGANSKHEDFKAKVTLRYQEAYRLHQATFKNWQDEWKNLYASYSEKLKLSSAVELWKTRSSNHGVAAGIYLFFYVLALGGLAALALYAARYILPQLNDAFGPSYCPPETLECLPGSPAKAIAYTATALLITSLCLWLVRTLHRVYLSNRHLSLSFAEKATFANSYLAMVKDGSIPKEHEAIILSALFRPTQEGIIRDDDGGVFDVSAASILAKALSSSKPQ
ncbi:DUF6161 domain-containing protein [Neogemmobacter tilapiae]|nr:DUF6161 domain-containing protein [Gemmobacter tilapiae]